MNQKSAVELTALQVTTPENLNSLNNLIHDEWFDVDEIQYDPEQGIVELPYRRKFHGGPARTIRNWLFYTVKEVDVIQSRLRIYNVNDYSIRDRAHTGSYSFNVAEYNQDTSALLLRCDPNLELKMKVSELLIESDDLEIAGQSRISYWFGIIESDRAA